jgi:hypothetical protein
MKQTGYFNTEINGEIVEVNYKYAFSYGRMYIRNGDPGYPDEEDIDFTVKTYDGQDITGNLTEKETEQIDEEIREEVRR